MNVNSSSIKSSFRLMSWVVPSISFLDTILVSPPCLILDCLDCHGFFRTQQIKRESTITLPYFLITDIFQSDSCGDERERKDRSGFARCSQGSPACLLFPSWPFKRGSSITLRQHLSLSEPSGLI